MIGMDNSYPLHLQEKAGNYFKLLKSGIYHFKCVVGTTATTVITHAVAVEQRSHHEQDLLSQVGYKQKNHLKPS